jgi:secreted trypsin-like serine protease
MTEIMQRLQRNTIENGGDAPIGDFPYAFSIGFKSGHVVGHVCMAVLVKKDVLVTAKHCVRFHSPTELDLKYGKANLMDPNISVATGSQAYCHGQMDLGAVFLAKDAAAAPASVGPVSLKTQATAVGFGATGVNPLTNALIPSTKLLRARLTQVATAASCSASATVVCASAPKQGPCGTDSGGPLVDQQGKLVGVLTHANGCTDRQGSDLSARYVTAETALKWIDQLVGLSKEAREKDFSCKQ